MWGNFGTLFPFSFWISNSIPLYPWLGKQVYWYFYGHMYQDCKLLKYIYHMLWPSKHQNFCKNFRLFFEIVNQPFFAKQQRHIKDNCLVGTNIPELLLLFKYLWQNQNIKFSLQFFALATTVIFTNLPLTLASYWRNCPTYWKVSIIVFST